MSKLKTNIKSFADFLILGGLLVIFIAYWPLMRSEIWYAYKSIRGGEYQLMAESMPNSVKPFSVFGNLLSSNPVPIYPVNKEFSIVIEKIGVNVPIVAEVSINDEREYIKALKSGVAHAAVSEYPSQDPGNVYLFAHASLNFITLGKYSTVFNLLRKLEVGDRIHVFYQGKDYMYETLANEVVKGWNTYPITRPVIEPTLTLQTCDPPGTTINRLVVTAKLVKVFEN